MHIALFFGSFNPVHTGHLIIANHVLEYTSAREVWMVVSPQNPHKPAAGLLNEYHRLHLCNLATTETPAIKPSSIEFGLPRPSYTIDTLTYLKEQFPHHQFSIVMGSDGLQNLHRWKNAGVLIDHYPLLVYQRPDNPAPEFEDDFKPDITWLEAPMLDISASYIRKQIAAGKSIRYLVHPEVEKEILKAGYYMTPPTGKI